MSDNLSDDTTNSTPSLSDLKAEGIAQPMVLLDQTGTIIETNEHWDEFTHKNGLAGSAVNSGTDYLAGIDPSESEKARQAKAGLKAVLEGERSHFELEYPCHGPETERWFLMLASGFDRANGRFVKLGHFEITELKQHERQLRESNTAYEALFDGVPESVFVQDLEGQFTAINATACSRLGYDEDELVGKTPREIVGAEYKDDFEERRDRFRDQGTLTFQSVHVTSDGDRFPVEVTATLTEFFGEQRILTVARDVTERKRYEGHLEEYRTQYQRIVERSPTPILAFDESGTILEANNAVVNLLDVSDRSNLVGTSLDTHVPDSHVDRLFDRLNSVLDGEVVEALQHPIIGADGERREVISTGVPEERPGETAVVAFVTDVTKQAKRERSFQRLQESSQEFLVADTPAQIGEEMVGLAADLFDITGAIMFHYDRSMGLLRPVATDVSSTAEGQLEPVEPDDGIVGETFVEGESRALEDVSAGQELSETLGNPESVYVTPLLGQGVFVVGFADSQSMDDHSIDIIDTLANHAPAAITGLEHRSQIEATDQEVDDLQRTVQDLRSTLELLSDLWETIDQSESRPEIERETCEKLLTGPGVVGTWIGERNAVTDSIETKAATGVASPITEHVDYALDDDSSSIPAVRALRESEPARQRFGDSTVVESTDEWARRVQTTDVGLVYSVPIGDTDSTYGVLTVFVEEESAGSRISGLMYDLERTLGNVLTHAINSLDRKEALVSDQQFELTYRISGQNCLFSEMANVLDGQVTFEKLVQKTDSATTVFVTMYDTDPAAVRALPSQIGAVHEAEILRQQSTDRITARIDIIGPFIGTQLSTWGANVSDITTEESTVRVVLTVPNTDLVSSIQTSLEERFSSVQMVSKRRLDDTETATTSEREQFRDRLTERQLEVFQTAYHAGYFESPRETNGEAVAEILGISSQAFYQHVRTIQRKLAGAVIGE